MWEGNDNPPAEGNKDDAVSLAGIFHMLDTETEKLRRELLIIGDRLSQIAQIAERISQPATSQDPPVSVHLKYGDAVIAVGSVTDPSVYKDQLANAEGYWLQKLSELLDQVTKRMLTARKYLVETDWADKPASSKPTPPTRQVSNVP